MATKSDLGICGCCAGVNVETPASTFNLPGQKSLHYRVGRHSQFKQSLLAGLSDAERPALLALSTRDDSDFSIAYLDASAVVLDLLCFYQERYANEFYFNTSVERRSVQEMAKLIGYRLAPGVSAATYLAFMLQAPPPGEPETVIELPAGSRVQSVPGQDETPQVFETDQVITAKPSWNAVQVQTTVPYLPLLNDRDLYVDGVGLNLAVGDAILLVGQNRIDFPSSSRWDVRIIKRVVEDSERLRTRIGWDGPLNGITPPAQSPDINNQLYVFRKKTALFGHNAPDPRLMSKTGTRLGHLTEGSAADFWWSNYSIQNNKIDLANAEKQVVAGSWTALVSNGSGGSDDLPGIVQLYRADIVKERSRTDYGLSGKTTRITPDTTDNLSSFSLQKTLVLTASEPLPLHPRPLNYPLYGDELSLAGLDEALVPGQLFSVTGRPQRVQVKTGITGLVFESAQGNVDLVEKDSLILLATPERLLGPAWVKIPPDNLLTILSSNATIRMRLKDRDGRIGSYSGLANHWKLDNEADDPMLQEIARINASETAISHDRERTSFELAAALEYVYVRESVRLNFNVAPANHGERVDEILGNGDASSANQTFLLKQAPLTHVSAATPKGYQADIDVRINELLWQSVSSLYQQALDARVYSLDNHEDGTTSIVFGDGIEGGRLPSGQTNVRASYRIGLGEGGNLDANTITTLLDRPLGVMEAGNPVPATGGVDAEKLEDARENAPLTVLTLDRAVSIQDYRNFARAFAGVSKAHALWISAGPSRGIFITLAGVEGAEIPDDSDTYTNLNNALRDYGDPLIPLTLVNYAPADFALSLAVKVADDALPDLVLDELEASLKQHFAFRQRQFGQNVSQDEVLAVAHQLPSVVAVQIKELYRLEPGATPSVTPVIQAKLPVASLTEPPSPAELLTIADQPIAMELFV